MHDTPLDVEGFARRYTAAWCSQDPDMVASFFAPSGSLAINDGEPSVGRAAIAEAARSFMTAFPDLCVRMDQIVSAEDHVEYHWTLTGTNTGPGCSGRPVRISGFEIWTCGAGGFIEKSVGTFDANEYQRQISGRG